MVSSDFLFHYTKSFEVLSKILKSRSLIPFSSTESFSFLDEKNYDPFVLGENRNERKIDLSVDIQMVCFCDLPVKLARAHSDIYGKYAIVFSKEWGIAKGINPVLYVSDNTANPATYFRSLLSLRNKIEGDAERGLLNQNLEQLICYLKPYKGKFNKAPNQGDNYRFYNEREWRYIPPIPYRNCSPKENTIKFTLPEIKFLVVENDSEKVELQNYIIDELRAFQNNGENQEVEVCTIDEIKGL